MDGKIIYQEKYKKTAAILRQECFPIMRNVEGGWKVHAARIMQAGVMEKGGKKYEYQDIRVMLEEVQFEHD